MKYDFAVVGAIILSAHNSYKPFIGAVAVNGEDIAYVGEEYISPRDCANIIDGSGKILMPGLVNGHCHGDMAMAKGLGDDLTLLEQNEAFSDSGWFSKYISDDDRFYARQLSYCEALLSGTTFIAENMYWSLGARSVEAMKSVGIRGALVEDVRYDFSRPEELLSDKDISEFAQSCREQGIVPVLGSVSEEDFKLPLLQKVKTLMERHEIVETCHLAETTWRVEKVLKEQGASPVAFLYDNGLLGENLIGSHVVHLTDKEVASLAETGTKVVNTPLCEMKICDGIAPIPKMLEEGVCVCLGTDGAMWNNSNDIFREMKGMSLLHSINSGVGSISKKEILDMATINGAKAFGLEKLYGTIEKGKKADFILVETASAHMQPLALGKHENVCSAIIYSATGSDVSDVFVNGKHLVENKELKGTDLNFIINKVLEASSKVRQHLI
ncbi:MAG: amidohydrolase family protein [Oscillospiraceae bacterium]